MLKISTSWDDGHPFDMKVSDMLLKYKIPGIFYIPGINPERNIMKKKDIYELSQLHKIGSHTYNHQYLHKISLDNVYDEVKDGRDYLESLTGKEIPDFCYPGGFYNKNIEDVIKPIVNNARTTRIFSLQDQDVFSKHTSIHLAERGLRSQTLNAIVNAYYPLKFNLLKNIWSEKSIYEITSLLILDCMRYPEVDFNIHIWGHSWEIDQYNSWNKLEDLFNFIYNINEK